MSCGVCGGTGWRVTAERHGVSLGLSVDPCDCRQIAQAPEDLLERIYGAVQSELEVLTLKRPSLDAALGRAYTDNALLRAEIADLRKYADRGECA